MPASAFSAWAVQMLWVAFSRRMCCSRVCRVEHEAAAPVDVGGLAGDPAGHAADVLLGRAEEAERGAAVVEAVAERLALAHRDVGAALAGRAQDRERDRVAGDDDQRPVLLGRLAERLDVLDRAEEVRLLEEDGGGLVVDRIGERGGVGDAAVERDLDELGPVAGRVGDSDSRLCGMDAARGDQLPAAGRADRQVGGRGDREGPS